MTTSVKVGHNLTGAQMSPEDTRRQMEATQLFPPDTQGDDSALRKARILEINEHPSIGTVPVPGSIKGAVKTSFEKLLGKNPEVLIDKIAERLAFERTGVRLYDALLAKAYALEPGDARLIQMLQQFQKEELDHFHLLVEALEHLGADPTAQPPGADLAGVAAAGVLKILTDPRTNLAQSLNAILIAELADNAGWELLIELADQAGQAGFVESFTRAREEEDHHLAEIKRLLQLELAAALS